MKTFLLCLIYISRPPISIYELKSRPRCNVTSSMTLKLAPPLRLLSTLKYSNCAFWPVGGNVFHCLVWGKTLVSNVPQCLQHCRLQSKKHCSNYHKINIAWRFLPFSQPTQLHLSNDTYYEKSGWEKTSNGSKKIVFYCHYFFHL